ncbi:MAG TPA: hypothetical protein ENN28_01140 [Candidatus Uhrbacteria bacterium]|nr:hypothetical protein [Candidatus Uhrbacteria bacterium]
MKETKERTRIGIEARDFDSFQPETKLLICAIRDNPQNLSGSTNSPYIIHLAKNLRRSESVIEAARSLSLNEPLLGAPQDWLDILLHDCLKKFHEESYWHLVRVRQIFSQVKKVWQDQGLKNLPDLGMGEFKKLKVDLVFMDEDWQDLDWAAAYHDLCKMAYAKEFWDTPGKFSVKQRKDLEAHARWFYFLGEMFDVPKRVTALAVLHHYLNLHYPENGVVEKNICFLSGQNFHSMLRLLVTLDVYEAMSGNRSYRQGLPHEEVFARMPGELKEIGCGFFPVLQAVKEQFFANKEKICPI